MLARSREWAGCLRFLLGGGLGPLLAAFFLLLGISGKKRKSKAGLSLSAVPRCGLLKAIVRPSKSRSVGGAMFRFDDRLAGGVEVGAEFGESPSRELRLARPGYEPCLWMRGGERECRPAPLAWVG